MMPVTPQPARNNGETPKCREREFYLTTREPAGLIDVGLPMRQFIPTLLEMARLAPGQRVLDVATGTGAAAELALNVIGPSGHVTALDIAAPMLDEARRRLGLRANVVFGLQDGQALTLPDEAFDAVLCSMALMIFKDRSGALAGFHRVLRKGGYAAVSLNTTAERSLTSHIRTALAQVLPERAAEIAAEREPHYGLGRPERIRPLFEAVGFQDVVTIWRHVALPTLPSLTTTSPSRVAEGLGVMSTLPCPLTCSCEFARKRRGS